MSAECDGIVDHMGSGRNELYCTCGERLMPDCDVSALSIFAAFARHLLERVPDQEEKPA